MVLYNLENVEIKKRGLFHTSVYIKGWAFGESDALLIRVFDNRNREISDTKIVRTKRTDVYKYHNMNKFSLDSGFEIAFPHRLRFNKIVLKFYDGNQKELCCKELTKKDFFIVENGILKKIKKTENYLKENGLAATIRKIFEVIIGHKVTTHTTNEIYNYVEDDFSYPILEKFIIVINATLCESYENLYYTIENIHKIGPCKIIVMGGEKIRREEKKQIAEIEQISIGKELYTYEDVIKELVNKNIRGEEKSYFILIDSGDSFALNILSYLQEKIDGEKKPVITSDEDRYFIGEYFSPFYKRDFYINNGLNKKLFRKMVAVRFDYLKKLLNWEIFEEDICIINKVLYHYNVDFEAKHKKIFVKPIAFYLPQFHSFPENDEWWGKGFTEWTNTRKGTPLFEGHYQPHEPGELGFYNLVLDKDIREKQNQLAKEYGIFGFCYYYYWFEGKKLMETPLNNMLADKSSEFPFIICWANETWSRKWDGQENEVLIKQIHNEKTDEEFIKDVIPIFKDRRYIKIDNKPLFLIYRAELFPNIKETVKKWNQLCKKEGFDGLRVAFVQTFGLEDPRNYGSNYAVEFPPHNTAVTEISKKVNGLKNDFTGAIYDYEELLNRNLSRKNIEYINYRGLMLGWDNTARRGKAAHIYSNFGKEKYLKWLIGIIDYTICHYDKNDQIIFINAWNEWAEGTHLEPDKRNGRLYLELTKKALNANY